MWTTRDGYELVLPRAGVDAVAARLAAGGAATTADARRAVVGTVARLAGAARRAPDATPPGAAAPRRRFVAERGARRYDILTRPLGARSHVITAVYPRPGNDELEYRGASTNFDAVVRFTDRIPLMNVGRVASSKRGLYVVELDGQPLYVGITTQPFAKRWAGRLRVFTELRLKPPPSNYTIALAEVRVRQAKGARPPKPAEWEAVLKGVEAAIVRTLVKAGKSLTNQQFMGSEALPIAAGERIQVTIEPSATKPAYLPPTISAVGPVRYEASPAGVGGGRPGW